MLSRPFLLVASSFLPFITAQSNAFPCYSNRMNPFIGTQGSVPAASSSGGNVFPGAALPFGAVKVRIDTTEYNSSTDADARYTSKSPCHDHKASLQALSSLCLADPIPKHAPRLRNRKRSDIWRRFTNASGQSTRWRDVLDNLICMQPRVENDTATVSCYEHVNSPGKYVLVGLSHCLPANDKNVPEQVRNILPVLIQLLIDAQRGR
jgi:hypothetical protein